ncbi:hypothetical protein [Streptomyces sp. NPDC088360]|uniref:hypothetical protein n=1 Tax=Streptomyces sp. NPDC088360 TaxID=3154515 RepID=UPI00344C4A09
MFKTPVRRVRAFGRPIPHAVAGLALAVAVAVVGNLVVGQVGKVWNGEPYPSVDPDAVAQRLKDRSDEVYDDFALSEMPEMPEESGKYAKSGKYAAVPGKIATGACSYRGLRGFAHIDEARSDVRSFGLDWSVSHVPEATARDAQQRVRQRLVKQGWKHTHDGDRAGAALRELGFRFEDPESGDQVDVRWNDSTTTLFISVYAPCGEVPDDFAEYGWSEADWHPKRTGRT